MTCHQIFYVTGSFPDIVLLAWHSVTLSKIGHILDLTFHMTLRI